jgi:23S rRNA (adenine2503-C2)-methyltransferase
VKNILDLEYSTLEEKFRQLKEPSFRASQIWEGLYKLNYSNWNDFSNLPISLRTSLAQQYNILSLAPIKEDKTIDDRTTKILFQLDDGNFIESVHLINKNRNTICISTQVGCPVGCVFCATGKNGFLRNLYVSEIIGQVLFFSHRLHAIGQRISNIVLMGMGEPFLNYNATLQAVKRFNDPKGIDLGARRITISTIGIVEKIIKFADEQRQFNLAISLHAPDDKIREELIPIAKKYTIKEILKSAYYYISKTNRRITYEYVLIDKINSKRGHAQALAELLKNQNCHVNLIGLNPNSRFDGKPPSVKSINAFSNILLREGISTTIRNSQGSKIKAGCGQLAGKNDNQAIQRYMSIRNR